MIVIALALVAISAAALVEPPGTIEGIGYAVVIVVLLLLVVRERRTGRL